MSDPKPGAPGRAYDTLVAAAVVILAAAGPLQIAPLDTVLPAAPTLLAAVVCLVLALQQFLRHGPSPGSVVIGLLFLGFVPGVLAAGDNRYAEQKSYEILTLALLTVAAPALLIRTPRRLTYVLAGFVLVGLSVSAWILISGEQVVAGRVVVGDLNPIALGRVCAAAAAILTLVALRTTRGRRLAASAGASIATVGTVSTGTRGALVSASIAILVVMLIDRAPGWGRRLIAIIAVCAAGNWLLPNGLGGVVQRVTTDSDQQRLTLYTESLSLIWEHHIFGIGWGNLAYYLSPSAMIAEQGYVQYSHNMLLEVAVEGGLIALVMLLFALGASFRRLIPLVSESATGAAAMAVWVFSVSAAMTSSDFTDNRLTLVMMGVGLASLGYGRSSGSDHGVGGEGLPVGAVGVNRPTERGVEGRRAGTRG